MSEDTGLTVRNYIEANKLKEDLSYSDTGLSSAMMEQAPLFAHYGAQHAKAQRQVNSLKNRLELLEAKVYRTLREQAIADGEKVTENSLGKDVAAHKAVRACKNALEEAIQIEANARIAVEAFRQRKDMLVSQGLISREEMRGDVAISRKREYQEARESQVEDVVERIKRQARETQS